jgi:CMP-N-acetylneuraminic acid synthetase
MKDDRKAVCLIPARGGSKGIKNKNLQKIDGKSLVEHAIESARGAATDVEIFVSSEDEAIISIAEKSGVSSHKRPLVLARDDTKAVDVIKDFLLFYEKHIFRGDFDLIYLQPTSPFRKWHHVNEAWKKFQFQSHKGCTLVSITDKEIYPEKCFEENGKYLIPHIATSDIFGNRQTLKGIYQPNGAIYICSNNEFLNSGGFPLSRLVAFKMPIEASIDIDSESDLAFAKKLAEVG